MSQLPLKQINIRLAQGKSNINDDTAVKEAVGKFSVNVMQRFFFLHDLRLLQVLRFNLQKEI